MNESYEDYRDCEDVPKHRSKKKKKTFRLEYRIRPERKSIGTLFDSWRDWQPYWKKYRTAEEREEAMRVLNRKEDLFEYRLPENENETDR